MVLPFIKSFKVVILRSDIVDWQIQMDIDILAIYQSDQIRQPTEGPILTTSQLLALES